METLSSAWHHDHPGETLNKYTMMPNVAWHAFEEVLGNKQLIKTGFRIAGLYPWDRKAVHWEKLDAGSLYVKEAQAEVSDDVEPPMEEQEANVITEEAAVATVEAVSGIPMEWAQDVADPSIAGLADPSFNNRQAPEVRLFPEEVLNQASSSPPGQDNPPGHDIANFVPGPGAQAEDVFPETSHEENLHLLHR